MRDGKIPIITINYAQEKDSDFSEKRHKKDFGFRKYEKFTPKDDNNYRMKSLEGAENKVKNLLSIFIQNYENEREIENSDIFYDDKSLNSKEINTNGNRNKKKLRKVKTAVNKKNGKNIIRTSSYNVSLNNINENNQIINASEEYGLHQFKSQKRKVAFNIRPVKHSNNQESYKDLDTQVNNLANRKKSKKNLLKDFIVKTTTITKKIIKRNKTGAKVEKKVSINDNRRKSNPINFLSYNNQLIKKTKFSSKNDNCLNFKNDNIILNKSNKHDWISSIPSGKKIKGILKTKKTLLKNDIFNDSNQNSVLSDLSETQLNKKSADFKGTCQKKNSIKKERRYSSATRNSFQNDQTNYLNLREFSKENIKNTAIIGNLFSSKRENLKKSSINKKNKSNFKKLTTTITKLKNKRNSKDSKIIKLDAHIKILKEKFKKTLILGADELEIAKNEEKSKVKKMKRNSEKNKSLVLNYENNLKLVNNPQLSKSNINTAKTPQILKFTLKDDVSIIKNKDIDDANKNFVKNTQDKDIKINEKMDNIENKRTLKSMKSLIESSKNSSGEEDFSDSFKRKNTIYFKKYRILKRRGNIYDSLDDEDIEDEKEIYNLYLDPHSTFTKLFDSILFIFTLISFIENPFYLSMNKYFCRKQTITFNFSINLIIDLLNIMDLFLGFFRAYYNWEEQLIIKHKLIAIKYLREWFIFDLIASIPIYTINKLYDPICLEKKITSKYGTTNISNLRYLLISNRLLKVFKIFWNNRGWKSLYRRLGEHRSIIVTIGLVLASINYTACMYIFIGRNSFPNWIFQTNLDTKSFIHIYICAIYILTMAVTTVGYGDITCYCMNEIIFQLFILIIGIIGYSYVITFISNHFIKINEKFADFEKKKKILDEIKLSYNNLTDDLYDRIVRHLKLKNSEENKVNNIIFDSLPVGLKNNLITEMYKPIITNFLFFKNFQNTDFIVRVILAFKPIVAYRNDILVNEGDMIEDIMFVKKGVLSVELPINIANPQENIDKYLKEPSPSTDNELTFQNFGKNFISSNSKDLIKKNSMYNSESSPLLAYNNAYSMKYSTTLNLGMTRTEQERKEREEKENEQRKNFTYVKIIGIRENEHFGDVLMFLEQRSPLRVRVKSIKCELFFLKKIDALKISNNYRNIWKSINKRSVFNFEQLKKCIRNIVEIYFAVKKYKSDKNINIKGIKKNSSVIFNKDGIELKLCGTTKEEELIKKNNSDNNLKIKSGESINYANFFENVKVNEDIIIKDNNSQNLYQSSKNLERVPNILLPYKKCDSSLKSPNSLSLSPSSEVKKTENDNNNNNEERQNSKEDKNKFGKKVLDVNKGKYKFYREKNIYKNKENKDNSIIIEETEQEGRDENYLNSDIKISITQPVNTNTYSSKNFSTNKFSNNNAYKNRSHIMKKKNSKENIELEHYYNKEINNELNNLEEIRVVKDENLLNKKIDLNFISTKQSEINNNNNRINSKKSKLKKLLESFDDEDNNFPKKDKKDTKDNKYLNSNNVNLINEKNTQKISSHSLINSEESNKNIVYNFDNNTINNKESIEGCISPIHNRNEKITKLYTDNNYLSINTTISFNIESSYENFNEISGSLLIKNKQLQSKLKNYLIDEIQNISEVEKTDNKIYSKEYKKISSLQEPMFFKGGLQNKLFTYHKHDKKCLSPRHLRKNKFRDRGINQSSSVNENFENLEKNETSQFQTGIDSIHMFKTLDNKSIKKRKTEHDIFSKSTNKVNIINNNINYINNSIIENQKMKKTKKNSSIIDNNLKPKKGKDSLLSKINFNIRKTNQNLNNPEEFYSSYFNSLLGGKKSNNGGGTPKRNNGFLSPKNIDISAKDTPKLKKRNSLYLKK